MITYCKLRDGSWGIRSSHPVTAGQVVSVTKKGGETRQEKVGRVICSGAEYCIATVSARSSARSRSSGSRYECEECGDYVMPGTRCWETGMMH
jgi:hypothetical protein